jgi:alpha-beta hydrolase superfamily lysophospholipase
VVVSHGYYDHAGTWRHAIPALLEAGNAVVIYDQPGHGLSSGARASISDFGEYVDVLECVMDGCRDRSELPIVLAGHSMGCAVITEYLLERDRAHEPARAVFVAPLVQTSFWGLSKVGQAGLSWAVSSVPRVFRKNSSDPGYLDFVKQDPLHHGWVPFEWIGALKVWNERAKNFTPSSQMPVRILQGAEDKTVQWEYNLDFLKSKFPDATVQFFPEGRHQLLNEAEPLRSEVLRELVDAVAGNEPSRAPVEISGSR